jgi:hypothetical protein
MINKFGVIASLISLAVIFATETIYHETWFNYSLTAMKQESFGVETKFKSFLSFYTELGGGKLYGLVVIAMLPFLAQRHRVVYLAILLSVSIAITNITKIGYS